MIGYYRRRNYTRSIEFAIQKEKEWDAIKPKEEEEEEDYGEEVAAVAEVAEDAAEEEEWTLYEHAYSSLFKTIIIYTASSYSFFYALN